MFHTDADGESVARLACYCTNLRRTEGGDVMPAFPPLRVAVTRVSRAIASAGELAEE